MNAGNTWFPDHALSAGCATWTIGVVTAFTDEGCRRMNIEPVYDLLDTLDPAPGTM